MAKHVRLPSDSGDANPLYPIEASEASDDSRQDAAPESAEPSAEGRASGTVPPAATATTAATAAIPPRQDAPIDASGQWRIDLDALRSRREQLDAASKRDGHAKSKRVREYYDKLGETIEGYEQMHQISHFVDELHRRGMQPNGESGSGSGAEPAPRTSTDASVTTNEDAISATLEEPKFGDEEDEKVAFWGKVCIRASFVANILLFVLKLAATIATGSLVLLSATLDSSLDIMSGLIIFVSNKVRHRKSAKDLLNFPMGKSRFEPLSFLVFAAIMSTMNATVIIQGLQDIVTDVNSRYINPMSADVAQCIASHTPPVDPTRHWLQLGFAIAVPAFTVVLKLGLHLLCRAFAKGSPSVMAYALDHRNDVFSNLFVLVGVVLSQFLDRYLWWTDPVLAILLSAFIIYSWTQEGWEHVRSLVGQPADAELLKKVTFLAYNHDARIQKIDTVHGFTLGQGHFVEVDICVPGDMSTRESHDIAESLQHKVERLHEVERCYIHIDYETEHRRDWEHKRIR